MASLQGKTSGSVEMNLIVGIPMPIYTVNELHRLLQFSF